MLTGASGALGCNSVLYTGLVTGDDIELSLAEYRVILHMANGLVKAEEDVGFLEDGGFRRVDVFASPLFFPKLPSTEGDYVSSFVVNGKHEAVTETNPQTSSRIVFILELGHA